MPMCSDSAIRWWSKASDRPQLWTALRSPVRHTAHLADPCWPEICAAVVALQRGQGVNMNLVGPFKGKGYFCLLPADRAAQEADVRRFALHSSESLKALVAAKPGGDQRPGAARWGAAVAAAPGTLSREEAVALWKERCADGWKPCAPQWRPPQPLQA